MIFSVMPRLMPSVRRSNMSLSVGISIGLTFKLGEAKCDRMEINRVEIYRELYDLMRSSGGEPPTQDILDSYYGSGWESDNRRIYRIDRETEESGEINNYLSPGLYALEVRETKRKEEVARRKKDKVFKRKKRLELFLEIGAAIGLFIIICVVLDFIVPGRSQSADMIATSLALATLGGIVFAIRKYRNHFR